MKNIIHFEFKYSSLIIILLSLGFTSCEREISDEAIPATYPRTPNIYTDIPVGLTDEFFISFDPASGANTEGFGTDNNVAYAGRSSIRIDVPTPNDPNGNFIGGIFKDRGNGRNLTDYDALTFWVKASTTASVEFGFGIDFEENKHAVSLSDVQLSTDWRQVVIPIPDPSKLVQEKGMFLFAAGTASTGGTGYTFWLDEIRFEKLGNIRLVHPYILNGEDITVNSFSGAEQVINQLGAVFNLANGLNQRMSVAPDYFDFISSNPSVTGPFEKNIAGEVFTTITGSEGSAVVTAELANVPAQGSLTINIGGSFDNAPDPTVTPENVISIYSDSYTGVTGFNPGFFAGPNTANISVQSFNNNEHISYESIDFIGMGWNGTVNASGMSMIHLDVKLVSAQGSNLVVELIDFGPDNIDNGFGDGSAGGNNISTRLRQDEWVGIDIPLNQFTLWTGGGGLGNPRLNNIGYVVLVSNSRASVLIDNVYFYKN